MYDLLKANMHDMYVEAGWGWDAAEKRREMEHRDARFLIARCRGSGGDEGGAAAAVASPQPMASCAVGSEAEGDAGAVKASSTEVRAAAVEDTKSLASVSDDSAVRCDGNPVGGGARVEDGASDNAVNVKEEAVLPAGEESERGRLAGFCHFRFAWDEDENEDGEGVGGKEDVLYVYELQVAPWTKRRGLGRRMMQALEVCQLLGVRGGEGRGARTHNHAWPHPYNIGMEHVGFLSTRQSLIASCMEEGGGAGFGERLRCARSVHACLLLIVYKDAVRCENGGEPLCVAYVYRVYISRDVIVSMCVMFLCYAIVSGPAVDSVTSLVVSIMIV